MGMTFTLMPIPDETVRLLLEKPSRIHAFLAGGGAMGGFLSRLLRGMSASEKLPRSPVPSELDLDKAWHGVHFLLCGEAGGESAGGREPECWLLDGGKEVGEEDVGYGPARVMTSEEVRRWSAFLTAQDEAELEGRYNPQKLKSAAIYPDIWDEPREEALGYLMTSFRDLREFVKAQADAGQGLLMFLC